MSIYKNGKINHKCYGIKFSKQKFHQDKRPVSIKNVDIDKIVVPNKVHVDRKGFEYFIGYKDTKKLNLYVYFSQK